MILTPRLNKIASLVPQGTVVADIGTDHAYIPVHCVLNGICPKAIAMDINEGPLDNARDTVNTYGVSDLVELRLSDGMEKLCTGEAGTVVIAGMGGLLIKSILERHIDRLSEGTTLILQPMLAPMELREYLYKSGNAVIGEHLAKEGDKIYNIITAQVGYKDSFTLNDLVVGRKTALNSPELFGYYRDKEINVRRKILGGLNKAKTKDISSIENIKKELAIFEGEAYED